MFQQIQASLILLMRSQWKRSLSSQSAHQQKYQMIKQQPDCPHYLFALTPRIIMVSEFFASLLLALGAMSCSYTITPDICLPVVVFWVNVVGCFTGAHCNAMITTSWIFKANKPFKYDSKIVIFYISAQILGVFTGGLFLKFIFNEVRAPEIVKHQSYWILRDMFGEMLISAVYSCICHIICSKKTTFCDSQVITWIMASFGVLLSRQLSPHSGACMNPSIAVGLNLCKSLTTGSFQNFKGLFVYIIGPITGSLVGTLYFDHFYLPRFSKKSQQTE